MEAAGGEGGDSGLSGTLQRAREVSERVESRLGGGGGGGHALGGRAAAEETEDSLEDEGEEEGEGEGEEGEREEEYDAHAGHCMLRCLFKSMCCYMSLNRH